MKSTILLLVLTAALVPLVPLRAVDAFEQNRRLGRGVNIIGYDPIWKDRAQARFQARHFQAIREAGFQHVRVNLHPLRRMDETNGWALPAAWWDTLDWVLREAAAQQLMVILDFHEFHAMADDPVGRKDRFLAFWRQVADHCADAPDSVLFELLNEPNKKLTPQLWNGFAADALKVVRAKNPDRTVVIGPAFWNSIDHLHELELPADDRNLIVTIHYYAPMDFTHQGAPWSNHKDKTDVAWPRGEKDRTALAEAFAKAAAWSRQQNRPLYVGEFGAYDKAPMESRVRYTAAVARAAEAAGWSWAWWQFDSDFLLWDMKRDAWVEPILRALIPAAPAP